MKKLTTNLLFTALILTANILCLFSQTTPTLKQVAKAGNVAYKGLFYNANYVSTATSRWIADKNYVDSLASLNDWKLTGNSGTTAANFIGTTDNKSFRFRTNNVEKMVLDSLGRLKIGTYSGEFGGSVWSIESKSRYGILWRNNNTYTKHFRADSAGLEYTNESKMFQVSNTGNVTIQDGSEGLYKTFTDTTGNGNGKWLPPLAHMQYNDSSANRVVNVTYTNTSVNTISIISSFTFKCSAVTDTARCNITVNGVSLYNIGFDLGIGKVIMPLYFIVPPGGTYLFQPLTAGTGIVTIGKVFEMPLK